MSNRESHSLSKQPKNRGRDCRVMTAMSGLVHYTRKRSWEGFNHTKYQWQPGRAKNCNNGCKPAIVVWPLLSKIIKLNPQLLPNRAVTSNSKVAHVFFKRKKEKNVYHTKGCQSLWLFAFYCILWNLWMDSQDGGAWSLALLSWWNYDGLSLECKQCTVEFWSLLSSCWKC